MSNKADAWAGNSAPLATWTDDETVANDTARLIAAQSSSITVVRQNTAQTAQTVRIDPMSGPSEQRGEAGVYAAARVLVLGYKDHATITDTDLRRGDQFLLAGVFYTVIDVMTGITGALQAVAEAGRR